MAALERHSKSKSRADKKEESSQRQSVGPVGRNVSSLSISSSQWSECRRHSTTQRSLSVFGYTNDFTSDAERIWQVWISRVSAGKAKAGKSFSQC